MPERKSLWDIIVACAIIVNAGAAILMWWATSTYTSITTKIFESSQTPYISAQVTPLKITAAEKNILIILVQIKNVGAIPANKSHLIGG